MATPPVSIVIVSRGRPKALQRCLTGVSQLAYAPFEVVVVACPEGIKTARDRKDAEALKLVEFDAPNISAARNLGIAQAAGEVVAFLDDDAVPETLWLHHLTAAFTAPDVAVAGGYVIGRNGISFQWKARNVNRHGVAEPVVLASDDPVVLTSQPDRVIKTEGTNMAVRRDVLGEIGGFDPAFHFYLDETDLNMRLAREGYATAIVPLAQVHHGYAESPRRAADRTPRDLTAIGASIAAFLLRHCPEAERKAAWATHQREQRLRCLRALQRGGLGADDVARLLRGLRRGYQDGVMRKPQGLPRIPRASDAFKPYPSNPDPLRKTVSGRIWSSKTLRQKAQHSVAGGAVTSLFLFSPTTRFHKVIFTENGVWEQRGGLFGRSVRSGPMLQLTTFSHRLKRELSRITPVRGTFEP